MPCSPLAPRRAAQGGSHRDGKLKFIRAGWVLGSIPAILLLVGWKLWGFYQLTAKNSFRKEGFGLIPAVWGFCDLLELLTKLFCSIKKILTKLMSSLSSESVTGKAKLSDCSSQNRVRLKPNY